MDAEHETVVHVTPDAPWLPSGGRAEVVRCSVAPQPMSIVRLLLRRGDEVFCVPRPETGKLDLPMRIAATHDADGSITIRALAEEVVGSGAVDFLGAVRNVVDAPADDYAWPAPLAHFGVWTTTDAPLIAGTWVDVAALRARHWHPLLG